MRVIPSCLAAAILFAGSAHAAALSPGRPAGVHAARTATANVLQLGAGMAVMTGVGILISGGGSALGTTALPGGQQVNPPVVVTSSSSTGT